MSEQETEPNEIIIVLNRAYQNARESSRRDTRDAAQKAFDNCCNWLRERRVPFYQTTKGEWVLDEMSMQSEDYMREIGTGKRKRGRKKTI